MNHLGISWNITCQDDWVNTACNWKKKKIIGFPRLRARQYPRWHLNARDRHCPTDMTPVIQDQHYLSTHILAKETCGCNNPGGDFAYIQDATCSLKIEIILCFKHNAVHGFKSFRFVKKMLLQVQSSNSELIHSKKHSATVLFKVKTRALKEAQEAHHR